MKPRGIALCTFILCFAFQVHAGGFSKLPVSARAVTMGGSLVSFADDPNALFYNPAGIASLRFISVSTSYTQLFPGITDDRLSYLSGSAVANLGFAGNVGVGIRSFSSNVWKEQELVGTYAQQLFDFLTIGGSAKLLYWSTPSPAGLLAVPEDGLSKMTLSFDVGAQSIVHNIVQDNDMVFGIAFGDITRPSIASNGSGDGKLDLRMAAGASYISRVHDYTLTVHYTVAGETRRLGVGAEFIAMKTSLLDQPVEVTVRIGGGGLQSSKKQADINGGLGLRVAAMLFDYAFAYQTEFLNIGGTHHLTLRYSF